MATDNSTLPKNAAYEAGEEAEALAGAIGIVDMCRVLLSKDGRNAVEAVGLPDHSIPDALWMASERIRAVQAMLTTRERS